jgi:carboxyl-terminal processing protease
VHPLHVRPRKLLLVAVLIAAACGGANSTSPDAPSDCSIANENKFVRDQLRSVYFWYRELPDPAPASFASPEAYLEAVRYKPIDTTYSYVAVKAVSQAFFADSQFVGLGFRTTLVASDDLRASDVYAGSPAAEAGIDRGARFLLINGRSVAQIVAAGDLGTVFGPNEAGAAVQIRFADRAGLEHDVRVVKRAVTIPPVAVVQTYRVAGRTIGYVLFEDFVTPATDALTTAFASLKAQGAEDLVLDLRYNGGGFVTVAQHLASLIGGARTSGQPFVRFVHNDKQSALDNTLSFSSPAQALGLTRLVVIATRSSASASELVINGLRPFMSVTVVGDRTYGKPVGQYGYDFCDRTLFPVAFATRNARNEGDYFDGIAADCAAPDDLGHALGDASEGSLAVALQFLQTGRCSAAAGVDARAQSLRRPPIGLQPHQQDGWRSLIGSY